jgi:flavin reductase
LVIEKNIFRTVMRQLAASVTVITTDFGGSSHGMTATAVCSVCADPPTILIVVNRSARTHPIIAESGIFVVNILARNQSVLSDRFAGKIVDQFAGIDYTPGIEGSPVLSGTAAHLECRVVAANDVGTHTIFIGQVIDGNAVSTQPLIYYNGKYVGLMDLQA